MEGKKIYIVIVAMILGILIVAQIRSFAGINSLFIRDTQSNIFQEIMILKDKNEDLRSEIDELDTTLQQLKNQNSALEAINEEIEKYKKITGDFSIFGPGIRLTINAELTTPWVIDLVNEFFNTGVQAVSINGVRLTNKSVGFDTLPQGQILLNGSIVYSPFVFDVIGESSLTVDVLELPGGIMDRLEVAFPDMEVDVEIKEIIQMDEV
ncbi:MAG: DUF881 domain-containing protein [Nitrospirota bacterium]